MLGGIFSAYALKAKGFGDHCNCKCAEFLCNFGNNGGCPRSCATAHTRGNKDHMGTAKGIGNSVPVLFGSRTPRLRFCPRTKACTSDLQSA